MLIQLPEKPFETPLETLKWIQEVFQEKTHFLRETFWGKALPEEIEQSSILEYFRKEGIEGFCLLGGIILGSGWGKDLKVGEELYSETHSILRVVAKMEFPSALSIIEINDKLGRSAVLHLLKKTISYIEETNHANPTA